MPDPNRKAFGIEFTDGKNYDLDEMIFKKDRANPDEELVMKVDGADVDPERPLEYDDGQLVMSETQDKLTITRNDVRKYLFDKKRRCCK